MSAERSNNRTVAVTGASGGVGSRVVRAWLAQDASPPLVAMTRTPERVPVVSGGRLQAVFASYDDVPSMVAALQGVSRLLFISSDGDATTMARHHQNVLRAVARSQVEHVTYMSILDVGADSPFYYAPVHLETEAILRDMGLAYCVARTSVFADFLFTTWLSPALHNGCIELPLFEGTISLVTRDDVAEALAAAAARGLTGALNLTGPAALGKEDIVVAMAERFGTQVSFSNNRGWGRSSPVAASPAAPWLDDAYATLFRSIEQDRFSLVSDDIERLLGRPPMTFFAFLARTGSG